MKTDINVMISNIDIIISDYLTDPTIIPVHSINFWLFSIPEASRYLQDHMLKL